MVGRVRRLGVAALLAAGLLASGCGTGGGAAGGGAKGGHQQAASAQKSGGKSKSGGGKEAGAKTSASHRSGGAKDAAARTEGSARRVQAYHFYMTILTGAMVGSPGNPTYAPGNFTLPPESRVIVTIRNYDTGTAPVPAAGGKVTGTVGDVISVDGKPEGSVAGNLVSHTFTVPRLHLNVPIPANATVSFAFHTPQPGIYTWLCAAPCGTGPSGTGGAMRQSGQMTGTMQVSYS